jgi:hypothetical protein
MQTLRVRGAGVERIVIDGMKLRIVEPIVPQRTPTFLENVSLVFQKGSHGNVFAYNQFCVVRCIKLWR